MPSASCIHSLFFFAGGCQPKTRIFQSQRGLAFSAAGSGRELFQWLLCPISTLCEYSVKIICLSVIFTSSNSFYLFFFFIKFSWCMEIFWRVRKTKVSSYCLGPIITTLLKKTSFSDVRCSPLCSGLKDHGPGEVFTSQFGFLMACLASERCSCMLQIL